MRDSNYKSVALNKAAVSITTNLYDRRALDCTSDRPLVNSLNHLTFLTSSSAKVRETLSSDGGLERLVSILHECKKHPASSDQKKSISEEKTDALIAWKWTLAFQCLVLIGTRGTEKIRKRVVEAGIIPIIATVLDNYLLVVRNFDNNVDNDLTENFFNLVNAQAKRLRVQRYESDASRSPSVVDDSIDLREFEITNFINNDSELYQYLSHSQSNSDRNSANSDSEGEVQRFLGNLPDLSLQRNLSDINQVIPSPRFFLNGILIPKDDDVVWSLQLLAFISKYSNLKGHLQKTHIIDNLSLRSLLKGHNNSQVTGSMPPPLENDDLDNEIEYELISNLSSDEMDADKSASTASTNTSHAAVFHSQQTTHEDHSDEIGSQSQSMTQPSTQRSSSLSSQNHVVIQSSNDSNDNIINEESSILNEALKSVNSPIMGVYSNSSEFNNELDNINTIKKPAFKNCLTKSLLNSIAKFERSSKKIMACHAKSAETEISASIEDNDERTLNLIELTVKLNKFHSEKKILSKLSQIKQVNIEHQKYAKKWNYDTYFNNPNLTATSYLDKSTIITQYLNIFPLVEKFTIKSKNSNDMCYWSGVIMRNSCRKDESRGGVRQCAYFACGKWESSPRQFAKCRRCKRTKYCSKDCQLNAWAYHKHWCVDSSSTSSSSNNNGSTTRRTQANADPTVATVPTTQFEQGLNLQESTDA